MGNKLFFYLTLNLFVWSSCTEKSPSIQNEVTTTKQTEQKKGKENVAHIWADAALYGTAI